MFLKEENLPDLRSEVVSKGASEPQAGPARELPLGAAGSRQRLVEFGKMGVKCYSTNPSEELACRGPRCIFHNVN